MLVRAALDAGVHVGEVYLDQDALDRPAVAALVDDLPAGLDPWVLPPGTLDRVGDAATSQGVLATVERVDGPWPAPDRTDLVVVLAALGDPGNGGTLLRAAVAAGAGAVVVAGGVDPTSPKVVRSSAGALFAVDVVTAESPTAALDRLHDLGFRTVGTTVMGGEPYDRVDLTGPVAVVLGNEAHGLAPDVVATLDQVVTVPMAGPTESLNVAMAGTVVVFEVLRQRRAAG
jgi:TrmH family RNA methyltransferase